MSRLKIEYTKEHGLFLGVSYRCIITDRRTDFYFIGSGDTKEEAKNEALDDFYKWDNEQKEYSYLESSIYYKGNDDSDEDDDEEDDDEEDDDD